MNPYGIILLRKWWHLSTLWYCLHPTFRSISIQLLDHLTMDFIFLGAWQGPQNGLKGEFVSNLHSTIFKSLVSPKSLVGILAVFRHLIVLSSSSFVGSIYIFCYWQSLIEMSMNQNTPYMCFFFLSILWCSQSNNHPKDDLVRFD